MTILLTPTDTRHGTRPSRDPLVARWTVGLDSAGQMRPQLHWERAADRALDVPAPRLHAR